MLSFDRAHTTAYSPLIETVHLSSTVFELYKPQLREAQLWLALCVIVACGISLYCCTCDSLRTPSSCSPISYIGKLIPAYCQCHCAGRLAGCISHHRQRRPVGWTVCIAVWLFNGLTASDRWHQIYRSQQRSLSLGKGFMLAETVAQTDAAWHRQMLRIISTW